MCVIFEQTNMSVAGGTKESLGREEWRGKQDSEQRWGFQLAPSVDHLFKDLSRDQLRGGGLKY